jgi:organic hydroperoxide reductase OsmC/OhrA
VAWILRLHGACFRHEAKLLEGVSGLTADLERGAVADPVLGDPGKPGTATPEHLLAAGYAACFGGALDFVAKRQSATPPRPRSHAPDRSACTRAAALAWI